jgi:hypothetical protein
MFEDLKEATLLEYVCLRSFPAVRSELVLGSSPRYINEKGQLRDASASIEPTWRKSEQLACFSKIIYKLWGVVY